MAQATWGTLKIRGVTFTTTCICFGTRQEDEHVSIDFGRHALHFQILVRIKYFYV